MQVIRRGSLKLLLSDTYQHAPLNTSPPYALPLELRNLERETQKMSEELRQSVVILQKVIFPRYLQLAWER